MSVLNATALVAVEVPLVSRWCRTWVAELWRYRDLLFFWTRREIVTRYRQTWLGATWAIVQPAGYMGVFWLCLTGYSKTAIVPYPLFSFIGSVVWLYFSKAVLGASASVVLNSRLVTQVYFPRLVIPLSIVIAGMVDLWLGLIASLVIAMAMGFVPQPASILFLCGLVLTLSTLAFGIGALLGALHVKYRDVGYALNFFMQLWFFLSPVMYLPPNETQASRVLSALNPISGLLFAFRSVICGGSHDCGLLGISIMWSVVFVVGGTMYFRRVEHEFADIV